jgi:excisionase family DNA binding protein
MSAIMEYLSATRETVLQWIDKKNMPAHKIGRQWRFKLSEVDDWIRSGVAAEKLAQKERMNNVY